MPEFIPKPQLEALKEPLPENINHKSIHEPGTVVERGLKNIDGEVALRAEMNKREERLVGSGGDFVVVEKRDEPDEKVVKRSWEMSEDDDFRIKFYESRILATLFPDFFTRMFASTVQHENNPASGAGEDSGKKILLTVEERIKREKREGDSEVTDLSWEGFLKFGDCARVLLKIGLLKEEKGGGSIDTYHGNFLKDQKDNTRYIDEEVLFAHPLGSLSRVEEVRAKMKIEGYSSEKIHIVTSSLKRLQEIYTERLEKLKRKEAGKKVG